MRFVALLVFVSVQAFADGEIQLPDFSKVNAPASNNSKSNIAVTCKTATGQTLRATDAGFEHCLSSAQSEATRTQKDKNSLHSGNTQSVEVKF